MDWKKLLGSITASVDEEIRLRNAYLIAENRILRQQIKGRVQLTDNERRALAEIGQQLGKKSLEEIATVAKPDTILSWYRTFVDQKGGTSAPPKSVGRPRLDKESEALVVRMARENRSWGYDRIVGALANLGYTISDQSVGNILKHHGIPPAPERKKTTTWYEFIRFHLDVLLATDFFTCKVWGWWGLVISCLLSGLSFARDYACVVGMKLYHQVRRMRLFLRPALDGHAYWQSAVHGVKKFARLQMIPCGAGVLGTTVSESTRSEKRPPRTQNMAKVVCLSTAYHRQIRDGPRRRQPWIDGLWKDDDCEAA
jgi:transposase